MRDVLLNVQSLLEAGSTSLGERIVKAARLAVAIHMHETLSEVKNYRQRIEIGGADRNDEADAAGHGSLASAATDGELSAVFGLAGSSDGPARPASAPRK